MKSSWREVSVSQTAGVRACLVLRRHAEWVEIDCALFQEG
jgi:hypothetical protein